MKNRFKNILNTNKKRNGLLVIAAVVICVGVLGGFTAFISANTYTVEKLGYAIELPKNYEGKVVFGERRNIYGETIIAVYHEPQLAKSQEFGLLWGNVLTIGRCEAETVSRLFNPDNLEFSDSAPTFKFFARDDKYYYYCEYATGFEGEYPTDVQAPPVNAEIESALREEYSQLCDIKNVNEILTDFVNANKLTAYSGSEVARDVGDAGYPEFTDKEIADAKEVVEQYFKAMDDKNEDAYWALWKRGKPVKNTAKLADVAVTVKDIRYYSQDRTRAHYAQNTAIENIIVFRCNFNIHYPDGIAKSAWNEGDYNNWNVILVRDNANTRWVIQDVGY